MRLKRCFLLLKGGHAKVLSCSKNANHFCIHKELLPPLRFLRKKKHHHNLRFFTNNFARCKGMSLNCYQNVFCWTWEIDTSRILRHENSLLKVEIMARGNIKSLDWTNCSLSCNRTAAFLFDWTDGNAKVIPKPQEQFPPRGKSVNDAVFLQCTHPIYRFLAIFQEIWTDGVYAKI